VPITDERLRELIAMEEGQYHDLKSLLEGHPGQKRRRDRREVRDQIAEQVARSSGSRTTARSPGTRSRLTRSS